MKRFNPLPTIFVAIIALIVPYILAVLQNGPDHVFVGFLVNPIDGASYLAKMYQGWTGSWRFTLPYTAQPHDGAYVFLYYLFLGHICRWTGIPLIWMFHLARLVGAGALLVSLIYFLKLIFKDRFSMLQLAYWLAILGAGMGWLVVFTGLLPGDFWVAEAYPFLSMFTNPHFPMGLALMVWAFILLIENKTPLSGLIFALLGLLISAIFQFALVVAVVIASANMLWTWWETRRLEWKPVFLLGILGGLYLIYQYLALMADPVLNGWMQQNLTPNLPFWDFILSFSPALPLAIWGAVCIFHDQTLPSRRLLISWLVLAPLVVVLPFPLQRRFILGYYIPVATLAVFGLEDLIRRWPAWGRRIPAITLWLALPTNLILILTSLVGAFGQAPVLYLTGDETRALEWIQRNTPERAIVLASPEMGRFIPAFTGRRVLYGHPFETIHADEEEAALVRFYSGRDSDVAADRYLYQRGVDFVFYGPREQALGGSVDLTRFDVGFQSNRVHIYTVEQVP